MFLADGDVNRCAKKCFYDEYTHNIIPENQVLQTNKKAVNGLSVDVEDGWYIFSRDLLLCEVEPTDTVVKDTEVILEILAKKGVKATFFVLGVVAAKFPKLVKQISEQGHEVGTHGYSHKQVFRLSRDQFREDVSRAKKLLEDLSGEAVEGHRAAAFSIMPETKWALEILAEEGFTYDSSIVPFKNPRYGWAGFGENICRLNLDNGLTIVEVPMTARRIPLLNKGFLTGGGYLRHFPYWVFKSVVRRIQKKRPVVVYVHPYEFGMDQPELSWNSLCEKERKQAARYLKVAMRNRETVPHKLHKLLDEVEFTTIRDIIRRTPVDSVESRVMRLD